MADPAPIDIIADRRVPCDRSLSFIGRDFTGSTIKMQVRKVKDTTGTALIDISGTVPGTGSIVIGYAGSDTITNHIAALRLTSAILDLINPATGAKYALSDTVTLSVVLIGITVGELAAIPIPVVGSLETGDDVPGWYDIIRVPPSGSDEMLARGKFTVRAGVTIP